MGARVAVAGASGYTGGELLRLLAGHPDLELGPIAAGTNAGAPVTGIHPNLAGLSGRTFAPTGPEHLAGADLIFLALPHGQAATLAARLPGEAKVIDLGPDFRLADPSAWARFYPAPYAGRWTYGLPELPGARERISAASRVAAPGCYATAAILALAPLLAGRLAEPEDIVIVAASGTSGAGRTAKPELLGSEVMGAVAAYQAGGVHRHTPEIEQALAEAAAGTALDAGGQPASGAAGEAALGAGGRPASGVAGGTALEPATSPGRATAVQRVTVSFTPLLAPMPRGILATCTARLAPGVTSGALRGALARAYDDESFVHLLPEGRWPTTAATYGSNGVQLQAAADTHAGRAIVVAALDNLGKGAAGQAVQDANLMLGLPESAGLTAHGVAP